MKQLTLNEIMKLIGELRNAGYSSKEIAEMPVYIGDDDELNGIHTAWYAEPIDPEDENYQYMVEMINGSCGNIKIEGKAILIS